MNTSRMHDIKIVEKMYSLVSEGNKFLITYSDICEALKYLYRL